jgi:hypothetical protein
VYEAFILAALVYILAVALRGGAEVEPKAKDKRQLDEEA